MTRNERLGLGLVALTIIVAVALVPTDPAARQRAAEPSPVDWKLVKDDPTATRQLTWQGIIAHVSGQEGSWIERNLETRFNLDLKPIFFDSNGMSRRRPLMLCGGDIPDIMWNGDPLGVRANLRNGFIMEVPYELILEHAPTYVTFLNRYGKEAWLYTHHNGRNYGLPTFFGSANRPRISAWRGDWLRRVDIERVPETIEEMHEALRRFRYNDPDGNGLQDTYGWSPYIGHWSLMFAEIFAAHDVLAFDLMEQDGTVVWGGILPGAKAALQVMRSWYAEDLLGPDFILHSQAGESDRKFINGGVGYLHPVDSFDQYNTEFATSLIGKLRAFEPTAEMVPGPPLRNAEGKRRGRTWGGAGHIIQFGKSLEQTPEKVIRVLKMVEAIARDETLYMQARYGKRGEHWDHTPESGRYQLEPYRSTSRLSRAELLPSTAFFFPSDIPAYDKVWLDPADRAWREANRKAEWGMMNVLGKSDVVPSAGLYLGDLRNFQATAYVEMVVGDRDIDDFDDFVSEWRRRGGDIIIREANEMYEAMQEVWERVGAAE